MKYNFLLLSVSFIASAQEFNKHAISIYNRGAITCTQDTDPELKKYFANMTAEDLRFLDAQFPPWDQEQVPTPSAISAVSAKANL